MSPSFLAYSDLRLKRDVIPRGRPWNGLGLERSDPCRVITQEVAAVVSEVVMCGEDGYRRVDYERLGLHQKTWEEWIASRQQRRPA